MSNNLNELNEILFDTLRDLKNDKIDAKKAKAITNVGNSIIDNAKTQLAAFKATDGAAYQNSFTRLPPSDSKQPIAKGLFDQKLEFAKEQGYKSLGEAFAKMGKLEFESEFNKWTNR